MTIYFSLFSLNSLSIASNAAYGSTLLDVTRHHNITYIKGDHKARLAVNDVRFHSLTELDDEYYELESFKKRISLSNPCQIGYFILQEAKKRMLEFHYDFLHTYFHPSMIQQLQMDTDSNYIALAAPSFKEMLKNSEMANRYNKAVYSSCNQSPYLPNDKDHWIPRECCHVHNLFDEKTPGLFKLEARATVSVNLCSKTYACGDEEEDTEKFSSKGLNKKAVKDAVTQEGFTSTVQLFKKVLDTGVSGGGVNMGFRNMNNKMVTYTQHRNGLSYFYIKRKVLDDGISTEPLDITLRPVKRCIFL